MLKGTKGLEKKSEGLKGFRKLFVVVLSDSNFYSLVCTASHFVMEFCPLFHVLFIDMKLDILYPPKVITFIFKIILYNNYRTIYTIKYMYFKEVFL